MCWTINLVPPAARRKTARSVGANLPLGTRTAGCSRCVGAEALQQIVPRCVGAQHPRDAVEDAARLVQRRLVHEVDGHPHSISASTFHFEIGLHVLAQGLKG
jgi:hypothetical protein